MTRKGRLDELVVARGFAEDKEAAERLIRSGKVLVNDNCVDKPGTVVRLESDLRIKGAKIFVSRAGHKLAGALKDFEIDVSGQRCLDVGIGTGGFTDCLLQAGAAEVYGVDVGYGDVDWKIRSSERVKLFERSNFRTMDLATLNPPFDLVVVDCSFISLEILFSNLVACMVEGSSLVALVKPQFEAKSGELEEGAVVTDPGTRKLIMERIKKAACGAGLQPKGFVDSSLPGAKAGNVECLLFCQL